MNKVVREHYPAHMLPDDLRHGIDPTRSVTVTVVEEEPSPDGILTLEEILAMRRPPYRTAEEIDRLLRDKRDEWND